MGKVLTHMTMSLQRWPRTTFVAGGSQVEHDIVVRL